jgi:hypothetical protein
MNPPFPTSWTIEQEARALLTRLDRVKPFALNMPMVVAAAVAPAAQREIEAYLHHGRRNLRRTVLRFIDWLRSPQGMGAPPDRAYSRFTLIRLHFNAVLSQFDTFAEVMTQRSQHDFGVWLSGLDAVAADALAIPGDYYKAPPAICYLVRGFGAAIRRARTRLPGGGRTPVAIIRIPRERMVGSGIASSLVHEVGHQAAALLKLVDSLRPVLHGMQTGPDRIAWQLWERWISEIVADFWSLSRVGITSTNGLIGVVSLPRPFVFRIHVDDPHPFPWIRVMLSCAIGKALFPHPQWDRLAETWKSFYPPNGLDAGRASIIRSLLTTMPSLVSLLVNHRPRLLRGRSVPEVLAVERRRPARLAALWRWWSREPHRMRHAPPSLVFAVIGQARADGHITPERESALVGQLLSHWALVSTFNSDGAVHRCRHGNSPGGCNQCQPGPSRPRHRMHEPMSSEA